MERPSYPIGEDVGAASAVVSMAGALVFYDEAGALSLAYAPGSWTLATLTEDE